MPKISIKPEPIFEFFHFTITNSYFTSFIVIFIFIVGAVLYQREADKTIKNTYYYLVNFIVRGVYDIFKSILGDKINYFFPILGAFFFYILLQNWFGLLPGVGSVLVQITEHNETVMVPLLRGTNADLNTTLGLGLVSVLLIQYYGIRFLGIGEYLKMS